MKIRQTCLSACAVAALLAGTAACTSDGGEPTGKGSRAADAAPVSAGTTACEDGTYAWFNLDKRDVLTGVAEKQKLGKGGGKLTHKLAPLHTPRVAVTFEKGARVDAEAALRSLGVHIGDTNAADNDDGYAFADVRRSAPDLNADSTSVDGAGTYVNFAWVRQVTADFQYSCGDGERVAGRATSWIVDGSGVVECSEPIGNPKVGRPALTAARLSCGPDAPAAKIKQT
ncbi:hypothetical protein [Streptomyces sp. ISL-100]|uniref:hypothetical protein n=1 Tax=Streptomyces sp. ISL-100 TaxID=2819173 RepID=UPI001BEA033C|nr:hypothetical protein [Streptomyces sp. ISL-100]MBT2398119.1 hypothetical protein [Streptomyces sp. ISL-100]